MLLKQQHFSHYTINLNADTWEFYNLISDLWKIILIYGHEYLVFMYLCDSQNK
jgi:hypothetical protein